MFEELLEELRTKNRIALLRNSLDVASMCAENYSGPIRRDEIVMLLELDFQLSRADLINEDGTNNFIENFILNEVPEYDRSKGYENEGNRNLIEGRLRTLIECFNVTPPYLDEGGYDRMEKDLQWIITSTLNLE